MKRGFMVFALLAGLLLFAGFAPASTAQAAETPDVPEVYVDDDFDSSTPGWGVTHFDTIQAGITAVDPGGTVNVAAGTYAERVTINKSLSLLGAGAGEDPLQHTILDGASLGAGASGIQLASGVTHVTIENLAVLNYTLSSTNYAGIAGAGNNNNFTAQHLWVKNNTAGRGGLYLNGPVDMVLINDVLAHYNIGRGIVIWNGFKTNITITNNDVQYNNCCGIELQDGTASGVTMSDNVVMNNTDSGLALIGLTSGAGANLISGNTLQNNGRFGIEIKLADGTGLDSGDGSIVVEENTVSMTTPPTDLRDYAGISAYRRGYVVGNNNVDIPTGVIIRNNTVTGYRQINSGSFSDGFGIVVEGTNMTVTGNTLENNDVGVQLQAGHLPYTPFTNIDGDQGNLDDDYFGRGNSPVGCAGLADNTYTGNTLDTRYVGPVGGGTVTNLDTGEMFCSIQSAIDDAETLDGHSILVGSGTYIENVTINKSIELFGESQADVLIQPALSNPDCSAGGGGGSMCSGGTVPASNIFLVQASDVTIHGFTMDGDNPNLSSGITCGGVDIDARNGIIEDYDLGVFDNLEVYNTSVLNSFLRSIYASSGGTGFNFHDNNVVNVQCDAQSIGIMNFGGSGVIANNTVDQANDGIAANHSMGTQFLNNTVTNSGSGVHTDNPGEWGGTPDLIQGNTVICDGLSAAPYGIWTFVTYLPPTVDQNTIENCGVGLSAWGEGDSVVTQFTNNTVTGPAGLADTVGAYITTDTISWGYADVSVHLEGNTISDFETGIYLTADQASWNPYPYEPLTVTATILNNSVTSYTVGLGLGVQGTYHVDASANWWGTSDPIEVKAAVNGGELVDYTPWLGNGVDTSTDPGFQGDFADLWVDDDSPQSGLSGRIQEGVDLALEGGTVNVAAGTYTEQVMITKDLTLLGEDRATTIIQAFPSMPVCFTTSYPHHAILCVMDAEVTIDNFTIDGLGLGNTNYRFVGVAFRNAGGTLQNSAVLNIQDTPFSGSQHGVAVYAYNVDETTRTVTVLDNLITGFQKNAMALNAGDTTPLIVDVQRNEIIGAGTTTVTAQNGIQVWAMLATGLVADNTIDGIAYDGSGWVATSILNYYADLDITGNTVTGSHMALYNIDGAGLIANNVMEIIEAAGYAYGIVATDPPQAVPSPFDAPARADGAKGTQAVLDVEVANNVLTFVGDDNTNSVAIEADGGYGVNDLNVNVHHNLVSGFNYGLLFYQAEDYSGVFTGLRAVSNDLFDNTMGIYLGGPITTTAPIVHHNRMFGDPTTQLGLYSELTATVTAENNWFGCNEGSGDITCLGVAGAVDADPWLVLSSAADPASVLPEGAALVTSDLIFNSDGADTSADGFVRDGILMDFSAPDGGVVDPLSAGTLDSAGFTTFTAPLEGGDYQVCTAVDNELLCVTVTVSAPPLAVSDTYTTTEETPLVVAAPGVLANDTDPEGDLLAAVLVTDVASGTLTLEASGAFTYTPDVDFFGVDTFTYVANDGLSDSNVATVTITVTNVNDLPVAVEDAYSMAEDTVLTIAAPGVLDNDTDPEGEPLAAVLVTDVASGTLVLNTDGSFTYTPEADFFGTDTFTYVANDGTDDSNAVTVTITVTDVPDEPGQQFFYLPAVYKYKP